MVIDSHCHLDRLDLEPYGGDLAKALDQARARGVDRMLCVGIDMANAQQVMAIAQQHNDIFASVGIHPMDIGKGSYDIEQLKTWAMDSCVVAVGETGLDYFYSEDSAELQQQSFIEHLKLASVVKKPVIVHTRDAREDTLAIIKSHGDDSVGGVLHCFTESWEMAERALEHNYYVSFSGIITFNNAAELREVAKRVPLDRLLVETDSPYLAPVPYRGKKNEPQYVVEVAKYLAELKGISYQQLAEATTENFYNLFKFAK